MNIKSVATGRYKKGEKLELGKSLWTIDYSKRKI
jgi:hypothetical protein